MQNVRTRHLASIAIAVLLAALPPLSAGCIDDGTPLPIVPRVPKQKKDASLDASRTGTDARAPVPDAGPGGENDAAGDLPDAIEPDADAAGPEADAEAAPLDAADGSSVPDADDAAPPSDARADSAPGPDAADSAAFEPSDDAGDEATGDGSASPVDASIDVLALEASVIEATPQ